MSPGVWMVLECFTLSQTSNGKIRRAKASPNRVCARCVFHAANKSSESLECKNSAPLNLHCSTVLFSPAIEHTQNITKHVLCVCVCVCGVCVCLCVCVWCVCVFSLCVSVLNMDTHLISSFNLLRICGTSG